MNKQSIGKLGEKYAESFLISQNYKIIRQNFRSRFGEIDLIAYDYVQKEIAFVEVKARTGENFGEPEDSVNKIKQRKIIKTALYFLNSATNFTTKKDALSWRVDVIAVKLSKQGRIREITHFKNILSEYGT